MEKVMRNKSISVEAKGIYAYLKTLKENGIILKVNDMVKELGMTRNRYFKYLKELREHGVLEVERPRKSDGTFGVTEYIFKEV